MNSQQRAAALRLADRLLKSMTSDMVAATDAAALLRELASEQAPALERFNETEGVDAMSPLERLRFFCSLAMNGRDWLDVEPFFDALAAEPVQEPVCWGWRVPDGRITMIFSERKDNPDVEVVALYAAAIRAQD